jgi:hypothetical protein
MVFSGADLLSVLARTARTENEIELRNEYGRHCRMLSHSEALALDPDLFVGAGNWRRIRFVRPLVTRAILNAGSHNTQRMNDGCGNHIAPPYIKEHRTARGEMK